MHKFLLLALTLAASPALAHGGLSDGGGRPAPGTACDGLAGAALESINLYEGGLTPQGPALIHYRVQFDDARFDYALSDFSLSGTYQCEGPEGAVTTDRHDFALDGFYNAG